MASVLHTSFVQIGTGDRFEAASLERCGYIVGVVPSINEERRVLVDTVPNDERDAFSAKAEWLTSRVSQTVKAVPSKARIIKPPQIANTNLSSDTDDHNAQQVLRRM